MKSYTDIEQSKKLAEILPLESADMCYVIDYAESNKYGTDHFKLEVDTYGLKVRTRDNIPCWSLAALYGILPNNKKETTTLSRGGWKIGPVEYIDKWFCEYEDETDKDSPSKNFFYVSANNPVDACYEMIIRLHELKML